ncbi:endonuclease domain-containing protein [Anoxybacteroides rupiense]|uniref:endonuclease domain-containing protein n=1 Tax=Anoxybacteroides rupiense TaxID=311460 RepID=UPI00366A5750
MNYYEAETEKTWNGLSDRVKQEIESILLSYKRHLTHITSKCESPIEQLLLIRLLEMWEYKVSDFRSFDKDADIRIFAQKDVEYKRKKYRVDIVIEVNFQGKKYLFAIECDGHEFHERTKEQALRDKKRQRELTAMGYCVIRFAGSEIWESPFRAAREVFDLIEEITGFNECLMQMFEEDTLGQSAEVEG